LLVDDVFKHVDAANASTASSGGRGRDAKAGGPVQPRRTRRVIRLASGVRWELLTALPDDELEFLYVVYDVGGESCPPDSLMRHGGKEYAYVLRGRLGVKVGFEEYELRAGDSMSFDALMPHRLWTVGDQPAVAIWAVLNRRGDAGRRELRAPVERRAQGAA
jgi:mannose-6-phosphate isomerase-like protein (cupin superfamily)